MDWKSPILDSGLSQDAYLDFNSIWTQLKTAKTAKTQNVRIPLFHLFILSQSHPGPQGRSLHSTQLQILLSVAQQPG